MGSVKKPYVREMQQKDNFYGQMERELKGRIPSWISSASLRPRSQGPFALVPRDRWQSAVVHGMDLVPLRQI